MTAGKLFTDPAQHAFSKIAGEVGICIDVLSHSKEALAVMKEFVDRLSQEISAKHRVRFELGPLTGSEPAIMDERLNNAFDRAAGELGIAHMRMASGAGHDAAVFAHFGVPSTMVFVRNQNGSHNPDEDMQMEDFEKAVRVIAHGLATLE